MNSLLSIVMSMAIAVTIYMSLWFLLALVLRRRDVVDSAWGLGFVLVATVAYSLRNNESVFTTISLLLVAIWGARLFLHITSRNWKKKEDYRYTQLGEVGTIKLWLKSYTNVFLLQGLLMILISLSVLAIMHASQEPIVALAYFGVVLWISGIIFETIGDYQLRAFLKTKKKGEVMQSGLWKYTRHPNYFGEVAAWWGAAIVAISFEQWWGIIGALVITVLITRVSGIPLLEKRYADSLEFQKYAKKTSIFFPLPPRSSE